MANFFRVPEGTDPLQQYEHLRQGLSRALCQQPIWAGILQQDERGAFGVHVPPAPNAGMHFYYSDLSRDPTYPSFDDFEKAGFPYASGGDDGLAGLRPEPFPTTETGQPTGVTQLTCIKGGMVLSSSMSHLFSDVLRARDFLVLWAECTRAVIAGSDFMPSPLPFELNDSSRLHPKPRGPATPESMLERSKQLRNFKLMDINDPMGTVSELQNLQPKAYIPSNLANQEEHLRTHMSGVWHFPKEWFSAASKYAVESEPKGVKASSMDVFMAFIWCRLFLAKYPRDAEREPPAESTILSAIDVRRKMSPPLPHRYQGAAVDLLRTKVPLSALQQANAGDMFGSKHLKQIAIATRDSQAAWSQDEYMCMLELTQQAPLSPGLIPLGPIDFLVTDHRQFRPVFEADFGPGLGVGLAFREPYVGRDIPAGEIEFMPGSNGGIDAFISTERIVLERFSADVEVQRASKRVFLAHDFVKEFKKNASRQARL